MGVVKAVKVFIALLTVSKITTIARMKIAMGSKICEGQFNLY